RDVRRGAAFLAAPFSAVSPWRRAGANLAPGSAGARSKGAEAGLFGVGCKPPSEGFRRRGDRRQDPARDEAGQEKQDKSGAGALHVVSAFAHEAGLVLAARAVEAKGNEITAIPELLDMLAIEGAIVTIDAIGTQKAIAAKIVEKKADYVLALKENQGSLHADVADFFADPTLAAACKEYRGADAAWLAERHPQWKG